MNVRSLIPIYPKQCASRRLLRRGNALIEYVILGGLYVVLLFGVFEFAWIAGNHDSLIHGIARAARDGAVGKTLATMRQDVRDGSLLKVSDAYIVIEYNSQDDGNGTWQPVLDDPSSGTPPTANAVPTGRPVRVRIVAWPHRLLAGSLFSWMRGTSGGALPLSADITTRRE